ncbi:YcjF family protein [Acuticoccus sp. M5D2P5]|uniref:YcjF family protein n=1 Tax=Acuticoccus kalidii TaxID=2910977 RepID=UPI001F469435|nr:YcjF family protein [Acuticoccus kalidii]
MTRRRPTIFEIDEVAFDEEAEEAPRAEPRREARRARPGPTLGPETLEQEEAPPPPVAIEPEPLRKRPGRTWLKLFTIGLSGLAGLALSISLYAFIEDLLSRIPALGYVAAVLAAAMVLGLFGMVAREWIALRRLKEVESLRRKADDAVLSDDRHEALAALKELIDLYGDRPETARGRKAMRGHMREIIDGRDLIALAEREVLGPLDRKAINEIVATSRRVAAVTALSPRALVDLAFVIFAALTLVRRIANIYGGRPGTLGFLRVLRHAVAHLVVTGGMAAGDTLVGEVVGQGIAARLSAKLGEGIVNALMTARLGLATLDVLRPLPFTGTRRPRINDILPEIARVMPRGKDAKE